ncbi:NAD kinase [Scrofimicrobium sp. R131]|uniref:NAD kinase n=1 Tax=Scrofimicrobium appendicitidis TaxID=3079930 RepID=A0AAU7VA02_9ACTO
MAKRILLECHPNREDVGPAADTVRAVAAALGMQVTVSPDPDQPPELVLALGGDGTFLAGARTARHYDIPLLGLNFGHMGFLADTSDDSLEVVVERIRRDAFEVENRMTLEVEIISPLGALARQWALNEAAILHSDLAHPADLAFAVDGQVVSTYGADGIILATPTGSTAYSFSAGGPVVWPDTEAIVMAPLGAHGLFTRPLVVSPNSVLEVGILPSNRRAPQVWIDGLLALDAPAGSVVMTTRGARPVRLARLENHPFSERLVNKFNLPVSGWRSPRPHGPNR